MVRKILEIGIDIKGYFIYGFPNETIEDFNLTYNLALKLKQISENKLGKFRVSVFQYKPYHGTKLYREMIAPFKTITKYSHNNFVSDRIGRKQFNLFAENYSLTSDEILNEYIVKTFKINE